MKAVTCEGWTESRAGSVLVLATTIHPRSLRQALWQGRGTQMSSAAFLLPCHDYLLLKEEGNPESWRFQFPSRAQTQLSPSCKSSHNCSPAPASGLPKRSFDIISSCLHAHSNQAAVIPSNHCSSPPEEQSGMAAVLKLSAPACKIRGRKVQMALETQRRAQGRVC